MQSSGQCKKWKKKILITLKEMSCSPIYHHALGPTSIKIKSSLKKVRFTLSRSDHFIISPLISLQQCIYSHSIFSVSSSHEKKEVNGPPNCCYRFLSHDSPKASKKKNTKSTEHFILWVINNSLMLLSSVLTRAALETMSPSLSLSRARFRLLVSEIWIYEKFPQFNSCYSYSYVLCVYE